MTLVRVHSHSVLLAIVATDYDTAKSPFTLHCCWPVWHRCKLIMALVRVHSHCVLLTIVATDHDTSKGLFTLCVTGNSCN